MNQFKNLGEPFYISRDERFKIIHDKRGEEEHHLVIDDEHYVPLVRGTLKGVGRGDPGALNYVMDGLRGVEISQEDVEKALIRGRVEELDLMLSDVIKENFDLRNSD